MINDQAPIIKQEPMTKFQCSNCLLFSTRIHENVFDHWSLVLGTSGSHISSASRVLDHSIEFQFSHNGHNFRRGLTKLFDEIVNG